MEQGPARTVFETSRGDYTRALLATAFDPEAREVEQGECFAFPLPKVIGK